MRSSASSGSHVTVTGPDGPKMRSVRVFSFVQAENDEPQPQVPVEFGFWNLKPEPCAPST